MRGTAAPPRHGASCPRPAPPPSGRPLLARSVHASAFRARTAGLARTARSAAVLPLRIRAEGTSSRGPALRVTGRINRPGIGFPVQGIPAADRTCPTASPDPRLTAGRGSTDKGCGATICPRRRAQGAGRARRADSPHAAWVAAAMRDAAHWAGVQAMPAARVGPCAPTHPETGGAVRRSLASSEHREQGMDTPGAGPLPAGA